MPCTLLRLLTRYAKRFFQTGCRLKYADTDFYF